MARARRRAAPRPAPGAARDARAADRSRRVKSFHGNAMRRMAYLVAHDSHHRGRIALEQHGMKPP